MKTRRISSLAALLIGLLALPSSSLAAPEKTEALMEAEKHFRRGVELFNDGDYAPALIEFRRANDLAPNPTVLLNIGKVCFQLQDYACALTTFRDYLAKEGAQISASRKASVEGDIKKLELRVGAISVRAPEGAEVTIDDIAVGGVLPGKPLLVNAGRRRVTISKDGRSATKVIDVAGGDELEVALDLPTSSAEKSPPNAVQPAPVEPPSSSSTSTTSPAQTTAVPPPPATKGSNAAVGAWSVTLLLGAGWGATLYLAYEGQKQLEAKKSVLGSTQAERNDLHDQMKTFALASDILGGVALAGAVTSLYLSLSSPSEARKTGGTVKLVPSLGGVFVMGTY